MRALLLALPLSILTLFPGSDNANAGDRHLIVVSDSGKDQSANPKGGTYHGYFLGLSEIAGDKDYTSIVNSLHHQLDLVEHVGLSPRVLTFFHSVPVVIDEFGCLDGFKAAADDKKPAADDKKPKPTLEAACYYLKRPERLEDRQRDSQRDASVWDYEKSEWTNPDPLAHPLATHSGVVVVRMRALSPGRPMLLHEMLHAYHAQVLPEGFKNRAILYYYEEAKGHYPEEAYLMTNEREFFAVTASVFLSGMADGEVTQSDIKKEQPEYYQYLGWLFGTDHAPSTIPVASAD